MWEETDITSFWQCPLLSPFCPSKMKLNPYPFSPLYVSKPPIVALTFLYRGRREEEKRDLKRLWGGGTWKRLCFLLPKQESGREATRWSLWQTKRVNIFGQITVKLHTVLEWPAQPQVLRDLHTKKPPSGIWMGIAPIHTEVCGKIMRPGEV